jgi:hypothetical protein
MLRMTWFTARSQIVVQSCTTSCTTATCKMCTGGQDSAAPPATSSSSEALPSWKSIRKIVGVFRLVARLSGLTATPPIQARAVSAAILTTRQGYRRNPIMTTNLGTVLQLKQRWKIRLPTETEIGLPRGASSLTRTESLRVTAKCMTWTPCDSIPLLLE